MNIDEYSISELEDLIETASDSLLAKKHPKAVMKKNTLLGDMKMCYSKVYFASLSFANRRAKNLSKRFKVEYRAYDCPNCGNFHLTTKVNNSAQ